MLELYKIYVVKEDGKRYVDLYLVWFYNKVCYERVCPSFKGITTKRVMARAIEAKNVQEMKAMYAQHFGLGGR